MRGLSVGADDYVVKPFSVPELMARACARYSRRSRPERIAERLYAGDLDLDRETRRVRRGVLTSTLGPTEFRLLEYLFGKARPGVLAARNCWMASRARRRRSTNARSTSMSGACARRAVAGPRARSDPNRPRHRLRLRRNLRKTVSRGIRTKVDVRAPKNGARKRRWPYENVCGRSCTSRKTSFLRAFWVARWRNPILPARSAR